jgi:hypothetical protein
MLDIYNEFTQLVKEFEKDSIDYALCGGLAVSVHGFLRATVDIDFVVLVESVNVIRKVANKLGYLLEAEPMNFSNGKVKIYRFTKIEKESGDYMPLDLLILSDELMHIWERREKLPFENGFVKVLSKEALIELKLLRNSLQDKQDIEKLKGGANG